MQSQKQISLVIMAAGIGSRYGGGIKQLQKVGPSGQIIIDYSIRDAIEAGFSKIVFVIRKDIAQDFKEIIGDRTAKKIEVAYCYQDVFDLPAGCAFPEGRTKPWGTGQAVLAAANEVQGPFAVINADDYYGKKAFRLIYDYLAASHGDGDCCMAGFVLKNTLSDNGAVTRGIVSVDEKGNLSSVAETKGIVKTPDGAGVLTSAEERGIRVDVVQKIDANAFVSMNMWGLQPAAFAGLKEGFTAFLQSGDGDPLKKEFLLPTFIDGEIKKGKMTVKLLKTDDTWFGVTYREDKESVVKAFEKLTKDGVYPADFD